MQKVTTKDLPQLQFCQPIPESLFYEGKRELLERPYLSVVGARDISSWVREWMEHELLPVLKEAQWGIISGGARGVDQWAHWLCLRAEVPTLVVLPSGLETKYPVSIRKFENRELVGFLSEYSPDEQMKKHHFYKRNRLIAGLSPLTLVIQARERSGTMITAQYAIEQGRAVATLPGHPLDVDVSGNNQLLFDGASLVRDQNDLLQIIKSIPITS